MIAQDWAGRTVVIAASGPSQNEADLAYAKDRAEVIAINETWRLAPWATALYACDVRWWDLRGPSAEEFTGLRFVGFGTFPGCIPCNVTAGDSRLHWCGTKLGAGANSGFQAINLAAVSGARRIVLTGFDMSIRAGMHWHGSHDKSRSARNGQRLSDPNEKMLNNCARIIDGLAAEFRRRGIEVINASRQSMVTAYPRMTIQKALA